VVSGQRADVARGRLRGHERAWLRVAPRPSRGLDCCARLRARRRVRL